MAYFDLTFSPNFELVSPVRVFVETFYARLLRDAEVSSRLAIATHELLENAVKYSLDGETKLRVELDEARRVLTIETKNRTSAESAAELASYLDEMNASGDPQAYYHQRMRRSMRNDASQLGLARIHCEAEMRLSCAIVGDQVTVHAETNVEAR